MKRRITAYIPAVLLLAACGGSDGGTGPGNNDGPTIASVTVSPANPEIVVGATQQMSATATDTNGGNVTGVTVSWSSSNTGVASVDTNGLVTGVAEGNAAITATISGVAGSQAVSVVPDECAAATTVSLAAGGTASYSANECLLLPAGSSGDYYRVAVIRPTQSENASNVSNAVVTATGIGTLQSTVAPTASLAAAQSAAMAELGLVDGTRFIEDQALKKRTSRFHMDMLEREIRERGPGPDGVAPNRAAIGPRLMADPPSRLELTSAFSCSASPQVQTLVNFDDNLAIYQDSVQRATNPFTATAAQMMLDYYDDYAKTLIPQYWGAIPDIDGNGRVIVTTSPALTDSVAAAIFTGDLRTSGTCSAGNMAEVIFFNVDLITELEDADPGFLALSTLAHEMKHIVSIYNRFAAGEGVPPLWIEEGLAEISAVMSSRVAWAATGGPALGEVITGEKLIETLCATNPCDFTAEIWGVIDAIANSIVQLSTHPNSLVTNPDGANQFHSIYASGWHFHRFLGDAYGNAVTPLGDGSFFLSLTDSTSAHGIAAHVAATGRTFDQLFEDMVTAMALHETPAPAPARDFTTWNMETATQIFSAPDVLDPDGFYPWPVTTVSDTRIYADFTSGSWTTPIGPSGIAFYDFQSNGSGTGLQLEIEVASPAKILVSRIR